HGGIGGVGGEQDQVSRQQANDQRHDQEDAVTHQVRGGVALERAARRRVEDRCAEADEQGQGNQHAPRQAFQRSREDSQLHSVSPPAVSEGGVIAWVATAAGCAAARASASTKRMIVAGSDGAGGMSTPAAAAYRAYSAASRSCAVPPHCFSSACSTSRPFAGSNRNVVTSLAIG